MNILSSIDFYSAKAWLLIGVLAVVIFFHSWQLGDIPRGLFIDEASIGYNAALISEEGRDEHGVFMPIYFRAYGEYKNPIYIYSAAIVFKVLGLSEFTLRFTSFLFFLLFLVGFCFLIKDWLGADWRIQLFALIAAGFLPWFFDVSRIAFEAISQVTVWTLALLFIYRSFYRDGPKYYPILAGLAMGLSIYAYSTSRFLTPLFLFTVILFFGKKYTRKTFIIVATAIIVMLPFAYFYINNPEALTWRFKFITYIYDQDLSLWEKIKLFLGYYKEYFSPNYLLLEGDKILRHHSGPLGELSFVVFISAMVGIIFEVVSLIKRRISFATFLLVNMVFAPVAAALTNEIHVLRSLILGLYFLAFSVYGAYLLLDFKKIGSWAFKILICFLILQSYLYVGNYFVKFPSQSVDAFEGYDMRSAIASAISRSPSKIIVSDLNWFSYSQMEFYKKIIYNSEKIPIVHMPPIAAPDTCLIFSRNDFVRNEQHYRMDEFEIPDSFFKLRCYY